MNLDKSKEVFNRCKGFMRLKECYTNIFYAVAEYFHDNFKTDKWRVAYGYMQSVENIYVRHCYIVDDEGNVIDPTAVLVKDNMARYSYPKDYLTFAILPTKDYIKLVKENDGFVGLERVFRQKENEAMEYALAHNIFLI